MTVESKSLLKNLIELSKIDVSLARNTAQKKKVESEVLALHASMQKEEAEKAKKVKLHDEKKAHYQKEEKRLRGERDKLVERRKALTTLNNYKLQEAAEKEIEHVSRQISVQEESILNVLEEVEVLAKQIAAHDTSLSEQKTKYSKLISEAKKELAALEKRAKEISTERQILANNVDSRNLSTYDRIREKFVMDPLAEVEKNLCKACNMQIGAQTLFLIGKGDSLVRCPGCARILFVSEGAITQNEINSEA